MAEFHSFVWLSNIYICVYIYICICIYMCLCLCEYIFIHSSVDGHLDCIQILAILNSAAINIGVHESF